LKKPASLLRSIDADARRHRLLETFTDAQRTEWLKASDDARRAACIRKSHGAFAGESSLVGALHHAIDHIQGASRWRMASGGQVGIGTKGITGLISGFAAGLIARVRLDLRGSRMRLAAVDVAMPPYNLELMLYSRTVDSRHAGAGAAVGPDFGVANLTAGVDVVAIGEDVSRAAGVALRMPRTRGQEAALRASFKRMVAELLAIASDATGESARRRSNRGAGQGACEPLMGNASPQLKPGELLKQLLGKYPDLTVNLIGQHEERKVRYGVSGAVVASIGNDAVKGLLGVEAGVEHQTQIRRMYQDNTGSIQVEKRTGGQSLKGSIGARATLRVLGQTPEVTVGAFTVDAGGIGAEWLSAGRVMRRDIVRFDGRLHATSFVEIEHQSLPDFTQSISARIEQWSEAKALQLNKTVEQARTEILNFLDNARQNAATIHSFAQRFELKPEVAQKLDALESLIKLMEQEKTEGSFAQANTLKKILQQALDSPSSYAPTSFRVYHRSEREVKSGVRLTGQLEKVTMAEGVYAHSRLM
jgi:hypothetical protein